MTLTCIDIGAEVRRRREYRRLSQRELATRAQVNQTTVGRVEAGRQQPQPRIIRALEAVLGRLDEPDPLMQKSEASS